MQGTMIYGPRDIRFVGSGRSSHFGLPALGALSIEDEANGVFCKQIGALG